MACFLSNFSPQPSWVRVGWSTGSSTLFRTKPADQVVKLTSSRSPADQTGRAAKQLQPHGSWTGEAAWLCRPSGPDQWSSNEAAATWNQEGWAAGGLISKLALRVSLWLTRLSSRLAQDLGRSCQSDGAGQVAVASLLTSPDLAKAKVSQATIPELTNDL
jgi:hypothetical protein